MNSNDGFQLDWTHWSVRQTGILRSFSEDRWVLIAQLLMLLNLVAMTRAFALVSLIEFFLWCLFLLYSPLRTAFLESLSDIRIKLVFAFWGWVAIATFWSPVDYGLRFAEVWSWRKLLLFPMAWVLFRDPQLKRLAIFTLFVTATVYMLFSWSGYLGYVSLDRPASRLLENHSTQGIVFGSASFLMFITLTRLRLPVWMKVFSFLLIAGMATNIVYVLTGKASYLTLLTLAPYAAWVVAPRLKWRSALIILALISLAIYNSDTAKSRISQGFEEVELTLAGEDEAITSMGIRWVFWENTLRMITINPILGSGSGGFSESYARIVAEDVGWHAKVTDDPHQQYLLIAGEQGLVGLALFFAILAAMLISRGDEDNRLMAFGILMATALNGMFNGHFGSFVEGRLFWIMTGVLLCSTQPMHSMMDARFCLKELMISFRRSFKKTTKQQTY